MPDPVKYMCWYVGLEHKDEGKSTSKSGTGIAIRCCDYAEGNEWGEPIDEFVKLCMMRGWIVNELIIENQIDIYVKAEEEIEFE